MIKALGILEAIEAADGGWWQEGASQEHVGHDQPDGQQTVPAQEK